MLEQLFSLLRSDPQPVFPVSQRFGVGCSSGLGSCSLCSVGGCSLGKGINLAPGNNANTKA